MFPYLAPKMKHVETHTHYVEQATTHTHTHTFWLKPIWLKTCLQQRSEINPICLYVITRTTCQSSIPRQSLSSSYCLLSSMLAWLFVHQTLLAPQYKARRLQQWCKRSRWRREFALEACDNAPDIGFDASILVQIIDWKQENMLTTPDSR